MEDIITTVYKHYISVDESGRIVDGFSDAFRQPKEGDVCIAEQGGYQFRLFPEGEENPPLYDFSGFIPLYKFEDGKVRLRAEEEFAADWSALPEFSLPDAQADTDALLIDHELRLTLIELVLEGEVD